MARHPQRDNELYSDEKGSTPLPYSRKGWVKHEPRAVKEYRAKRRSGTIEEATSS